MAIVVTLFVEPARGADGEVRAVSLAPHLTELAFQAGAGDVLVGVVEWSDFPEAAAGLPRIGDAFRFDTEAILALGATHALVWTGGTPEAAISQLERFDLQIVRVEIRTLDQIGDALEQIGQALGSSTRATKAADAFRARLAQARERHDIDRQYAIRVFYQVSRRPLFTLGARHVIGEVLDLCGAVNVFSELDSEAASVGIEAVIDAEPDVIVAGLDGSTDTLREQWQSHDQLEAVRCGRLHAVDPALLVRPTPRLLDGADQLCKWLDRVRQAGDRACRIDRD